MVLPFSRLWAHPGVIAKATGATVRSVRNWQETSAIRPQNDERLRELREIVSFERPSRPAASANG